MRTAKKLIWILAGLCLILTAALMLLLIFGYFSKPNASEPAGQQDQKTGLVWVVLPNKNYDGLTLVVNDGGKVIFRDAYQGVKLNKGYEMLVDVMGPQVTGVNKNFVIYNLTFSERNELSAEALKNYLVADPFLEIYYWEAFQPV
jgi:hypothetical protein